LVTLPIDRGIGNELEFCIRDLQRAAFA